MSYRNEQDANADRTRARIARMREELASLEAEVGPQPPQAMPPQPSTQRGGWLAIVIVAAASLALLVLCGVTYAVLRAPSRRMLQGAADSPIAQLDRRVVDPQFEGLHDEMQACAPAGFDGRIQSDVIFEGSTGGVHEVDLRNEGTTTLELGMMDCVEQTYRRIGVPRFRADQYRYRRTLVWAHGVLTSEADLP